MPIDFQEEQAPPAGGIDFQPEETPAAPEVKLKLTPYEQLKLSAPQGMPQMGPFGPTGGQFGEVIAPPVQSVAELKGAAQTGADLANQFVVQPALRLLGPNGPVTALREGVETVVRPATGVLHEALAPIASETVRRFNIDPTSTPEHILNIPRLQGAGPVSGAAAGVVNLVNAATEGLLQPENAALAATGIGGAGLVSRIAALTLSADQLAGLPDQIQNAYEVVKNPSIPMADKVEAVGNPLVAAGFAGLLAKAGLPEAKAPVTPPLTGRALEVSRGARPPKGPPPEPLQIVSPEQAAAQTEAMQRKATAAFDRLHMPRPHRPGEIPAPPLPPQIQGPPLPKASVPSGPGEPPTAPVPPQPAPPAPPEIRTWDDAVASLSARGTGNETRAQVQAMFPQLKLTRETAGDLAKAAFGDEWKPGGAAPQPPPPKAPAQPPPVPTLPVPAEGTVRLYHGEGGAGGAGFSKVYWSDNPEYAARYGPNVEYVDVPANVAEAARKSAQAQGIGTPGAHELPDEWVRKAKPVAAAPPAAHEVERPEVSKLGPPGGRLNPYGDPAMTVYHATPEDWAVWQDIQTRMRAAKAAGDTAGYFELQAEAQPFQKRYGGMPPAPPKSGETAPLRATKENPGPHRLVPTLVVNGKRFYGMNHAEALRPALFADEDAISVYNNDANHLFEDENGNLLTRQQATERYKELTGEKMEGGLHSEMLSDAWKAPKTATEAVTSTPKPAAAPVPAATPEPEWLGKPLSYWDNVAENLPHGDERARLAKSMGVPNQPQKIANHIRRRVAEIRAKPPRPPKGPEPPAKPTAPATAPPSTPPPVRPAAAQPAPPTLETSPTGELIPTEATPRTGAAARAYIIRRLEELEDIDPITGQAVPKEDLTEAQEKARASFRAKLAEIEQQMRSPAAAPQKPAAPPAPVAAPATKPVQPKTPPIKTSQPTVAQQNQGLEEAQRKYEQAKQVTAAARQKWEASEERGEHSPLYKQLQIAEAAERTAGGELAILRASIEGHAAGSQVQPEPSEPTVTSKILVEQKQNLLGQVDAALKNAGKGPEKITFVVPGDGDFTILNNENSLKRFRNIAESYFPETVPTKKGSRSPNLKAPSPPKPAKASDIPKIVGQFASEDEKRPAIQHVYSDGTQMVATDGRRLLRFVGTTPGTPAAPVRLTPEGRIDKEAVEQFPNYNQYRSPNATLAKGGADSAALWKLARQASAFRKTFKEGTATDAVTLYLNADGSFGMRSEPQPGEIFESNVKPDAVNLGSYNAQYLADGLDAARRLGSEKIDIYVDGETGPLVLQGQNWEYLLMGMKSSVKEGPFLRDDPAKYSAALAGQSTYPRLPEGLSPLRSPEEFNARQTGSFNVIYENGKFRVQHERKVGGGTGQKARSEWTDVAEIAFNGKDAPKPNEINDAAKVGMDRDLTKDERASIQAAAKQLLSDRQKVIDEAKERQNISVGPGAASPAEFEQRPDPEVVNLAIGSPALARLTRQYQNFFNGIRQLFARRGAKRDMMSLMNAANGLADVAGLRAGKAISARATSPEALRALTFVIQALKMSGEGLSADAEERLGQLEFAGDPEGYLRTKQADMETAAQQFAQNGQAVEAHAAKAAAEAMLYARQHFNQLRPAADRFRQITDRQHARLANAGIDVAYENWYVPQRHDLDMFTGADRPIVLGHGGGAGGSTQFKKAKTFEDYASAIEAGFVPRSLSANELLHHYVSTTERLITTKAFFDGLREVTDPVDGKAVVTDVPRKVIQRADGSIDVQETVPLGYTVHQVTPGVRLAVHNGYPLLIDALTARSQLAQSAAFGTLQDIAAFEKHIGLALDTFHASRVTQTELAMTGKLSIGERQRLGRALVEYSPADLDAAVQAGEITQEMADFIRRPQEMQVNGKAMKLSPANVFILGLRNGLNVGRFADVIYRQWLRDIPGVGQINRWVFDKQTRAATANGFAAEFERVAAARPDLTANEVARTVARDVNVLFGNLQKESIFRNPSLRTILQVVFLAPEWVQGMARREGRAPLQLAQAGIALAKGEPVHLGTAARTMGRGLAAYIVGTQLLNLITRHQLTFYNQERGHKLDAWVPIGKHGFFLSPLSVFGEITHDLIRLAETKPDFASVLTQIGANKLGNIGRAIGIAATGRDPFTGDKIIGTSRRAMRAALQLVPTPITISQPLQAAGAALGVARPPQEGAVARQVVSSLGFKTEPAPTPGQQVYQLAQSWMRTASSRMQADAQRRLQEDFGPSDYRDLRSALAKDDLAGARKAYQALRQQGKTPKQIRQTIQHPHPFTGSAAGERQFKASLSPEDRKLYDQAIQERRKLYQQFQQMLNTQPR